MKWMFIAMVITASLLSGCSTDEEGWLPPPQQWHDISIRIETRPTMLRPGMNEFLVIANRQQRGFSSDLIVDVRTEHSNWRQAMPDGALGVYRRALPVKDVSHDHLYVRITRSNGDKGELVFPLAPSAQTNGSAIPH
jgi:hypothetical protein